MVEGKRGKGKKEEIAGGMIKLAATFSVAEDEVVRLRRKTCS